MERIFIDGVPFCLFVMALCSLISLSAYVFNLIHGFLTKNMKHEFEMEKRMLESEKKEWMDKALKEQKEKIDMIGKNVALERALRELKENINC